MIGNAASASGRTWLHNLVTPPSDGSAWFDISEKKLPSPLKLLRLRRIVGEIAEIQRARVVAHVILMPYSSRSIDRFGIMPFWYQRQFT